MERKRMSLWQEKGKRLMERLILLGLLGSRRKRRGK
jgi:hypothetical protein